MFNINNKKIPFRDALWVIFRARWLIPCAWHTFFWVYVYSILSEQIKYRYIFFYIMSNIVFPFSYTRCTKICYFDLVSSMLYLAPHRLAWRGFESLSDWFAFWQTARLRAARTLLAERDAELWDVRCWSYSVTCVPSECNELWWPE